MISRMFARAGREARHLSSVYFQEYNQSTAPSYYLRGDGGAWGIRSLTMYCTVSPAHSLRLPTAWAALISQVSPFGSHECVMP